MVEINWVNIEVECRVVKIRWLVLLCNGLEVSLFLFNKGEVFKRNVLLGYYIEMGEGFLVLKWYFDLISIYIYLFIYLYWLKVLKFVYFNYDFFDNWFGYVGCYRNDV